MIDKLHTRLEMLESQMTELTKYYNSLVNETQLCSKNIMLLQGRIAELQVILGEQENGDNINPPVA